jgi:transcriptional regulator with XRE-family HTH domain
MEPDWRARIREARLNEGLTQAQLAEFAGLSPSTLRGYERGRRRPTREHLVKMLDVMKLERGGRNQILADAGFAPDGMQLRPHNPDLMFTVEECAVEVQQYAWPAFVMNEWSEVVVANDVAQRLWGVDLRSEFTDAIDRNLLSIASNPRFAERIANWDEAVGVLVAVWKGHHRGAEDIEKPSPYFAAVLERFLNGEPKYIGRFLSLWRDVPGRTPKMRWSYPVVWNDPGAGVMRFKCFASSASEPDGLAFNDWIPLDAETWSALEELRRGTDVAE